MKKISLMISMLLSFIFPDCGQKSFDQHLRLLYRKTVPLIHPYELAEALPQNKTMVLLDTRSWPEYEVSHLPYAKFVDYESFSIEKFKNISWETPIIVYCSVGVRSERIGEKLQQAGFKNVRNLYGGIFKWKNKGFTVYNLQDESTDRVHAYNRYWGKWLIKATKVYE